MFYASILPAKDPEGMGLAELTDYQLYAVIQNARLYKGVRALAKEEFKDRQLTVDQIQQVVFKYDSQFKRDKGEVLPVQYRILIILCSFLFIIHSIVAGSLTARGQNRKAKDYWRCVCIGCLFWSIIMFCFATMLCK